MTDKKHDIRSTAYRKYQLDWMASHGYGICDIDSIAFEWAKENDLDGCSFLEWIGEYGFGGEIWACKDEFLDAEYQDVSYMANLLTAEEFREYLAESGNEIPEQMPEQQTDPDIRVFHPGNLKDMTPRSEIDFTLENGETATGAVLDVVDGIAEMVFKDCLETYYPMHKGSTNHNEGGFEKSDLRLVLNRKILENIPYGLREIMVPFENGGLSPSAKGKGSVWCE